MSKPFPSPSYLPGFWELLEGSSSSKFLLIPFSCFPVTSLLLIPTRVPTWPLFLVSSLQDFILFFNNSLSLLLSPL